MPQVPGLIAYYSDKEFEDEALIRPSTSSQFILPPSGKIGFRAISVDAVTALIDEHIQAENIKKDIDILGVVGTYVGAGANLLIVKVPTSPIIKIEYCNVTQEDTRLIIGG